MKDIEKTIEKEINAVNRVILIMDIIMNIWSI